MTGNCDARFQPGPIRHGCPHFRKRSRPALALHGAGDPWGAASKLGLTAGTSTRCRAMRGSRRSAGPGLRPACGHRAEPARQLTYAGRSAAPPAHKLMGFIRSPSQSRSEGRCRKVSRLPSTPCGVRSSSHARTERYTFVTCHSSGSSSFPWLTTSKDPAAACAWRNTHAAKVLGLRATVYRVTGSSDLAHPAAVSTKAMRHVARGTVSHQGSFRRTGLGRSGNGESLVTLHKHHKAGCSGVTPSGPDAEVLGSGWPIHPVGAGAGVQMQPEPWSSASLLGPPQQISLKKCMLVVGSVSPCYNKPCSRS